MRTIQDINPNKDDLDEISKKYAYQKELTSELDSLDTDFNQTIINEIVLWKVNRYAKLNEVTLELLNCINKDSTKIDIDLTRNILLNLLTTKGIRLAMASTILRFKNPKIYQIFDQRVYRQVYRKNYKQTGKDEEKVELYLQYLGDLKCLCDSYNIDFLVADRVLYQYDIETNDEKINY